MTATKLSWRSVKSEHARALADALETLIEPRPDAVTRFEEGRDAWRVEAYFSGLPNVEVMATGLAAALGQPVPPVEARHVPELDWVTLSQAALPPVEAGRFVVHGSHDRGRIARGPNAIQIDAGEAFGTAHHASTLGCLLAIDRLARVRPFRRVLDLGCGSGVLAIAAARALPRAEVLASDSDAKAIAVATANARANGVGQRIAFACATGLAHPWLRHAAPFDLVVANILAAPLRALAPSLARAMRPGATLVLAGVLDPEASAVAAAYGGLGFTLLDHRRITGWSTLILRKGGLRPRAKLPRPRIQPKPQPIAGAARHA